MGAKSRDPYALYYAGGRVAGAVYPWPREWRDLYRGEDPVDARAWSYGGMLRVECVAWARGFRHACMDRVAS
jgi:hypothetical protein